MKWYDDYCTAVVKHGIGSKEALQIRKENDHDADRRSLMRLTDFAAHEFDKTFKKGVPDPSFN